MTINDLVEMSVEDFQKKREALRGEIERMKEEILRIEEKVSEIRCELGRADEELSCFLKEEKRASLINKPSEPMVKCDCGHTIPKHSVMSASMGSSCPYCYDNMSY